MSTATAPWYVIPADSKPAARVIIATIIVELLAAMDPAFPDATTRWSRTSRRYAGRCDLEAPRRTTSQSANCNSTGSDLANSPIRALRDTGRTLAYRLAEVGLARAYDVGQIDHAVRAVHAVEYLEIGRDHQVRRTPLA